MKKVLFVTGTRADFGKLKPLISVVSKDDGFECKIFCTGMHLMEKYGNTIVEIHRAGFTENIYPFLNQIEGESMELVLSNTIAGLSRYVHENKVDLIVVHGDRIEALAGATVGALKNILVAHVEGGEVSGTIDDLIRHACSKMSHIHFVASKTAEKRLKQLGEDKKSIYRIGSPDIDIMLSDTLPSIDDAKKRYDIQFENFAIATLHPVTTEIENAKFHAEIFVNSILESNQNYILIYPNNDLGSNFIFDALKILDNNPRVKIFPSIRFEYFLTLLKYSNFIIGNSSTGIHEAPVYGVPTINIGTRQYKRFDYESINNVPFIQDNIQKAILEALHTYRFTPTNHYGNGNSAEGFLNALKSDTLWGTSQQKIFSDLA